MEGGWERVRSVVSRFLQRVSPDLVSGVISLCSSSQTGHHTKRGASSCEQRHQPAPEKALSSDLFTSRVIHRLSVGEASCYWKGLGAFAIKPFVVAAVKDNTWPAGPQLQRACPSRVLLQCCSVEIGLYLTGELLSKHFQKGKVSKLSITSKFEGYFCCMSASKLFIKSKEVSRVLPSSSLIKQCRIMQLNKG